MTENQVKTSRAQISRAAIQRLYIGMRHLFIRGSYKPLGVSGEAMINALLALQPEIYGSIADPEKVELSGLLYIFQRLPEGIEECRFVKLISREGYEKATFTALVPAKRRRDCYRIDDEQMYIEMTRGRSDIYDVLTHLTFMYIEAEKIQKHALDLKGRKKKEWLMLEDIVGQIKAKKKYDKAVGFTYLSALLGRTYDETAKVAELFEKSDKVNSLFNIVYWLGYHSIEERTNKIDREISFSSTLREKLGLHIFGEIWARNIKNNLHKAGLINKEIHIISANLHSVMNSFFALATQKSSDTRGFNALIEMLSDGSNKDQRDKVQRVAIKSGMMQLEDNSGANIGVQIFDCSKIDIQYFPEDLKKVVSQDRLKNKVIIVIDYAFGEQAYELMDELLKPYELDGERIPIDVKSVGIMGKAGILQGGKGDIMVPNAHVFEGSADNYPFENSLSVQDFEHSGLGVYEGPMITVLGTSLQNEDVLRYFSLSSWKAIGLEMEGAHYQKAIQGASKIRGSIDPDVTLRYAYYASDNPLKTGSTLASGGLGVGGVKPTYEITLAILKGVMG